MPFLAIFDSNGSTQYTISNICQDGMHGSSVTYCVIDNMKITAGFTAHLALTTRSYNRSDGGSQINTVIVRLTTSTGLPAFIGEGAKGFYGSAETVISRPEAYIIDIGRAWGIDPNNSNDARSWMYLTLYVPGEEGGIYYGHVAFNRNLA